MVAEGEGGILDFGSWILDWGLGESFDGGDVFAGGFEGGVEAGVYGQAVYQDGANAAFGFVAADFGAGEAEVVAEEFGKVAVVGDVEGVGTAVDG